MTRQTKPIVEATSRAFEVLVRELGPSDTIRFINQFGAGFGNDTAERDAPGVRVMGEPGRVTAFFMS